jgi:hypothetical protein
MVTATHKFEYKYMPIRDLAVKTEEDQKTGKPVVQGVIVDDERHDVTERFWTSMFARYGFNKAFFRFFNHEEVFNRISEVESADRMRLCIERDANGKSRLLGVSSPTKAHAAGGSEQLRHCGGHHEQPLRDERPHRRLRSAQHLSVAHAADLHQRDDRLLEGVPQLPGARQRRG